LSSTNGTFVDGVRVQRAPVAPGAQVRLGDAYLLIS
jgi:pSer/pThr/pTyr-binding forkhead associated (FHA) protein